jgi:hypothetical protein
MGTMRAFYVRLKHGQDDLTTLRRALRGRGTLSTEPGKEFAWVDWPRSGRGNKWLGCLNRGNLLR